jgi:hypothetical protein
LHNALVAIADPLLASDKHLSEKHVAGTKSVMLGIAWYENIMIVMRFTIIAGSFCYHSSLSSSPFPAAGQRFHIFN